MLMFFGLLLVSGLLWSLHQILSGLDVPVPPEPQDDVIIPSSDGTTFVIDDWR